MDIGVSIANAFSCLITMIISAFFFSKFNDRRVSKSTLVVAILAATAGLILFHTLSFSASMMFIGNITLTFGIAMCYRFKVHNAFLMSILTSIFFAVTEQITNILLAICGITFEAIWDSPYLFTTAVIMSKFLAGIFVMIVLKGRHVLFQSAKNNNFIGILLLPLTTGAFFTLFWKWFLEYDVSIGWQIASLVTMLLLILSNVTIFYVIDRQHELISTKQRLKTSDALLNSQREYYEKVLESQQEIMRIRHDLKNIFIAVLSCIDSGEYDEARRMLENQMEETSKSSFVSGSQMDNFINSVIYSKKTAAQNQGVALHVVRTAQREIQLDYLDVAIMIANLLDNAIEAASGTPELERQIVMELITTEHNLLLSVENPTINQVDVNHIETTKNDKKNHGFGILSVKSIVKKYNGDCVIACNNGVFSVNILIPNNEEAL